MGRMAHLHVTLYTSTLVTQSRLISTMGGLDGAWRFSEPGTGGATGSLMLVPEVGRLLGFLVHSVNVSVHAFLRI